jgi:hypothetical protein
MLDVNSDNIEMLDYWVNYKHKLTSFTHDSADINIPQKATQSLSESLGIPGTKQVIVR